MRRRTRSLSKRRRAPSVTVPSPLPDSLRRSLEALCRRQLRVAWGEGAARLLIAALALALLQGALDWWFDFPWALRAVFLALDIAALGGLAAAGFWRPWRCRLDFPRAALRMEERWPHLEHRVISAVQLAAAPAAAGGSGELVRMLCRQAAREADRLDPAEIVPIRRLRRLLGTAFACLLLFATAAALTWPTSRLLAARLLLANPPLPTKTMVVAITRDLSVPPGADVRLAARAEGIVPSSGRLGITFANGQRQDFAAESDPNRPEEFSVVVRNAQQDFRYAFSLNDGRGETFAVHVEIPPAIESMDGEQIFPPYTGLPPQKRSAGDLSLLIGSRLAVRVEATQPLERATVRPQGNGAEIPMKIDAANRRRATVEMPIHSAKLTGFTIRLENERGTLSADDTLYRVDVLPDLPPALAVLRPEEERQTITPRSRPALVFDATDDFGLGRVVLHYQLAPPVVAGQAPAASEEKQAPLKPERGARFSYVFDPANQNPPWREGWTVNFWIEAEDNNDVTGPGRSATKRYQLGIVSAAEKKKEILDRFREGASALEDLSKRQERISTEVGDGLRQP